MKFEYKLAASTALFLILLGAGSIASAVQRVPTPVETPPVIARERQLIIPVDGIDVAQLTDSWGAPRGTDRRHEGIDIMAAKGTPVRAAAAGRIARLFKSKLGGTTVYQFDESGGLILYYAHLDRYAPGLKVGDTVAQGQVVGFVGSTGNATIPHLHFEIQRANAAKEWWRGASFNPYFALKYGWTD